MQLLGVSKESKTRDIMRRYSKWRNSQLSLKPAFPSTSRPFGVLLWARQKVLGRRAKIGQMTRQSLGSRMWQLLLSARAWRYLLGQPRWLLLDAWLWLSCTCWPRTATWMVCPSSSGSSARKCAWWNGWSACSRALLTSLSMTCRIRWTCSLGFRIGWNTSSVYNSNNLNRTVTNPLLSIPRLILVVSGGDIFYLKIILEYWQV